MDGVWRLGDDEDVSTSLPGTKFTESSYAQTPPDPTKLCTECLETTRIDEIHHGSIHQRFDDIPNLPRLLDSATTGCVLCQYIRETILAGYSTHPSWKADPFPLAIYSEYEWAKDSSRSYPDTLRIWCEHLDLSLIFNVVRFHVSTLPGRVLRRVTTNFIPPPLM